MTLPDRVPSDVPCVLLVELGGAAANVLVPLAESSVMPNLAGLLQTSALAQLRLDGPCSAPVAWTTLAAGAGPGVHGMLDDLYLDHRTGRILPGRPQATRCDTLAALVAAPDGEPTAVQLADVPCSDGIARPIWRNKPADFERLSQGIARTKAAMRGTVAAARRIDRSTLWRLLEVRFTALDSLLHRLWNLLGIGAGPGGNRQWVAKTQEAFRTLDDCLGELLEMAGRRGAAVVMVSPYGFGPSREKITLAELLRRRDLLQTARGMAKVRYRTSRLAWKVRRRFDAKKRRGGFLARVGLTRGDTSSRRSVASPSSQPIAGLLPLDWRRSRAVALHGQAAALVYLNTPERFGTGALTTRRQYDQAAAEVVAALAEARHPVSGEPLFGDVYLTEERFGHDPLLRFWPEVIAIPAAGFHTRHGFDRNRQLVRSDPARTAARAGEGLLTVLTPGVVLGQPCTAEVADVAPTVLGLLGLPPGREMTGRVLEELFAGGAVASATRSQREDRQPCRIAD